MKKLVTLGLTFFTCFSIAFDANQVKDIIKERDAKIQQLYIKANIPEMQKQLIQFEKNAHPGIISLISGLTTLKKNPIKYKKAILNIQEAIHNVEIANDIINQKNKINQALYNIQNEVSQIRQDYNSQILSLKKSKNS